MASSATSKPRSPSRSTLFSIRHTSSARDGSTSTSYARIRGHSSAWNSPVSASTRYAANSTALPGQDVGQGDVAPVEPGQVQADQQHDQGVDQQWDPAGRQPVGEHRAGGEGEREVAGDERRSEVGGTLRDHRHRLDGREVPAAEVAQQPVLPLGDLFLRLLHCVEDRVEVDDGDDVSGQAAGHGTTTCSVQSSRGVSHGWVSSPGLGVLARTRTPQAATDKAGPR